MVDPKLLDLLNQGAKAWNRFRATVPGDKLDLRGAPLQGADLAGVDFTNVNLEHADLSGANLQGAQLRGLWVHGALLVDADLAGAHLNGATVRADCSRANFTSADADRTTFVGSNLTDAHFSKASLSGAIFRYGTLERASFVNADLLDATFWQCELEGADFRSAIFGGTSIALTSLKDAKGLAGIIHAKASAIDAHSLIRSQNLPEGFLQGIGVPDSIIAYYGSLVASASPIQFYSCFISHSSKDEEFCRRLHNDLQAAGVRCWFAPEDLKIGDKFRTRIEESIRVYDKLLIVLSEHSINSQWVSDEIEAALEKEGTRQQTVLFPIRVDDAVMDANEAWARSIKRTRHIGDFTGWKDQDAYQKAFERLMRDLRASADAVAGAV